MYARILAIFLMDEQCRPLPRDMRLWVDLIRFIKESAPAGGLDFFTYTELVLWVVTFLFFRLSRLQYAFFVLAGLGFWSRDGPNDEPRFHLSMSKLVPHFQKKITGRRSSHKIGGPSSMNNDAARDGMKRAINGKH